MDMKVNEKRLEILRESSVGCGKGSLCKGVATLRFIISNHKVFKQFGRKSKPKNQKSKLYIMFLCRPHKREIHSCMFSKCLQENMFLWTCTFQIPSHLSILTNTLKMKRKQLSTAGILEAFLHLESFDLKSSGLVTLPQN